MKVPRKSCRGSQISSQVLIDNLASPSTPHLRYEHPVPQAIHANLAFDTSIIIEHSSKATPPFRSPTVTDKTTASGPGLQSRFLIATWRCRRRRSKKMPNPFENYFSYHLRHRSAARPSPSTLPTSKRLQGLQLSHHGCLRTDSVVI